jgi:hypothetical protein
MTASSWLPPLVEEIGQRRFMFHPPVANVQPNDWRLGGVSTSSLRIVNSVSGVEVSVPRQFVGNLLHFEGPVPMVGLVKELEFRDGAAWPVRRVIEMPRVVESPPTQDSQGGSRIISRPATVIGIRLERTWDSLVGRLLLLSGVGAALVSILVAGVLRDWVSPARTIANRGSSSSLGLHRGDDYRAITYRLGLPVSDRTARVSPQEHLRALQYPQLRVTVLLLSQADRQETYVGAVDPDWRVIQWVGSEGSKALVRRMPHS